MAFHRLTVPVYSGGLRGGDDYINNAVSGTPAPADGALGAGTYIGSYFFGPGDQVTGAAINRGFKALAQNCDFLDDAVVALEIDVTQALADAAAASASAATTASNLAAHIAERSPSAVQTSAFAVNGNHDFWRVDTTGGAVTATMPAASTLTGRTIVFKDVSATGAFATNGLTVAPNGADKIEGINSSFPFEAAGGRLRLYSDGTDWWIV